MVQTPFLEWIPSISVRRAFTTSETSPRRSWYLRSRAMASSSSMKMMQGAICSALW